MFQLSPLTTDNLIEIIGIIGTIITIITSVIVAKNALKNTLLEQKTENSLKRIDALPDILNDFINSNRALIIYSYVIRNEAKHKEASQAFDAALPKLQNTLLMYGSIESVKVFYELISQLRMAVGEKKDIKIADLFSLLLLLCSQIRYDLTNEKIGLDYYFYLLAPEMKEHKEEVFASARGYSSKLKLSVEI